VKIYIKFEREHELNEQAYLIPWRIWQSIFEYCSTTNELARTQSPLANAAELQRDENPLRAFLCVLFGHLNADAQALLDAAERMGVNKTTLCIAATYAQRKDLLERVAGSILSELQCDTILKNHFCDAIIWAVKHGYQDIFNLLADLVGDGFADLQTDGPDKYKVYQSAFSHAVGRGHLDILNRVVELVPQELTGILESSVYKWGNCSLQVFNRLIELVQASSLCPFDLLAQTQFYAVGEAVKHGNQESLNRLLALAPDDAHRTLMVRNGRYPFQLFEHTVNSGNLEMFKRLLVEIPAEPEKDRAAVFESCAQRALEVLGRMGDLEFLDYFIEQAPHIIAHKLQIKGIGSYAITWAASGGHLDVLNRLIERTPQWLEWQKNSQYPAFTRATKHLPIINRLVELAPAHVDDMLAAGNYEAIYQAYDRGTSDVLTRLTTLSSAPQHAAVLDNPYFLEKARCWHAEFVRDKHSRSRSGTHKSDGVDVGHRIFQFNNKEDILGTFLARNLLHRNEPETYDILQFLLRIPAIAVNLHTSIEQTQFSPSLAPMLRESAFVAELTAYKQRRSADPRGEYYSSFARFFSGEKRSKTAKLNTVDTLIYRIQEGIFDIERLPEAAENGDLSDIVRRYRASQNRSADLDNATQQTPFINR